MDVVYRCCAGLDVHQATVVATVRRPAADGTRESVTATFGTMTPDLLGLREWLHASGVTHVALESTGVYWKPIYYALEDGLTLLLINMHAVKHVPGRKTDVRDSEWLAQLLEVGLLRPSLVPPPAIRELRDLTRYRTQQVRDRAQEVNRLCKVLEDAGVKLSTVATNVLGVSGRAMITALVEGRTDPDALADLARGKLRAKIPKLRRALQGRFRAHHAVVVTHILAKIDFLEETLTDLTHEIDERLRPFEPAMTGLDTIPGVNRVTAMAIVAETGADMRPFASAAHLCSWATVCPGQNESAGKRRSGRTRQGNRYLKGALIQAANAAAHSKQTALHALYVRVKAHRGHKRAIIAVAHQILMIAYYIMRDGVTYHELGPTYFEQRNRERAIHRHVKRLEALGLSVTVTEAA
jgi:transposase